MVGGGGICGKVRESEVTGSLFCFCKDSFLPFMCNFERFYFKNIKALDIFLATEL